MTSSRPAWSSRAPRPTRWARTIRRPCSIERRPTLDPHAYYKILKNLISPFTRYYVNRSGDPNGNGTFTILRATAQGADVMVIPSTELDPAKWGIAQAERIETLLTVDILQGVSRSLDRKVVGHTLWKADDPGDWRLELDVSRSVVQARVGDRILVVDGVPMSGPKTVSAVLHALGAPSFGIARLKPGMRPDPWTVASALDLFD